MSPCSFLLWYLKQILVCMTILTIDEIGWSLLSFLFSLKLKLHCHNVHHFHPNVCTYRFKGECCARQIWPDLRLQASSRYLEYDRDDHDHDDIGKHYNDQSWQWSRHQNQLKKFSLKSGFTQALILSTLRGWWGTQSLFLHFLDFSAWS